MLWFKKKTDPTEISGVNSTRVVTTVTVGQRYHLGLDKMSNSHILVVGNSDSNETRNVLAGALIQNDKSYIVNDPKGKLYEMCGSALKKIGYKVELLDFDAPEKSDTYYNPFLYIKSNDEYKRDVYDFCHQALIDEMKSGYRKKYVTMCQLMLSIVLYMASECNEEQLRWHTFFDLLQMADEETGDGRNQLEAFFEHARLHHNGKQGKRDNADYLKMYRNYMNTLHTSRIQLDVVPEIKMLFAYALPYAQQEKAGTIPTARIDFEEFLNKKVALFVKAEKDSAKLLPTFYSQSHWNLAELRCEKDKQNGISNGTKWLMDGFPVMFLLNDFTSIGEIPAFYPILGTNRGYGIVYMISLKSLSDLQRVYEDNWDNILGLCDTMIFTCNCDSEIYELFAKRAALPSSQTPGNEVLLQRGNGWFCDKVFDVDKRLKELS